MQQIVLAARHGVIQEDNGWRLALACFVAAICHAKPIRCLIILPMGSICSPFCVAYSSVVCTRAEFEGPQVFLVSDTGVDSGK